ncbi:MAG: helix-turn-helix transcriptional regulator [Chloroflexi bacterium]|nr:helix-turn-helix transcriptional regulator [Chloroflexota bacterium]
MCNHHQEIEESTDRCCPRGGRVRGFMQPWLLLLLAQRPAHGYELMERLSQGEATPAADPGLLYRTLRQFEEEGLVRSSWDTEGGGPARRVYEITAEGLDYLHAWVVNIRRTRERLDRFLSEYEAYFHSKKGGEQDVRTR